MSPYVTNPVYIIHPVRSNYSLTLITQTDIFMSLLALFKSRDHFLTSQIRDSLVGHMLFFIGGQHDRILDQFDEMQKLYGHLVQESSSVQSNQTYAVRPFNHSSGFHCI